MDVAQLSTWPEKLRKFVAAISDMVPTTEHCSDINVPDDADDTVRAVLSAHKLRAFHATRLLDHERDMVATQGLRVFSRELFDDRIDAAFEHAAINANQHEALLAAHMYATGEQHMRGKREGQVCLVVTDGAFDQGAHGMWPLLSTWGGEGIYYSKRGIDMEPLLRRLGKPTIVEVSVPVQASRKIQFATPELAQLCVATLRRIPAEGELHHQHPIPSANIIGVWQPGHPNYDRHTRLPRF